MEIRFAEDGDLKALARFNQRLRAGGREEQITLRPSLPGEARYRPAGFPVYRRMMIAEDGREIRAAMLLYHHNVFIKGERRDFCWADMPVSEGIIDRKYSLAIIQLMKTATTHQPFLMTMGVGTPEVEAFRFLVKLGWRWRLAPFFFYPVRVTKALLGLRHFKERPKMRYAALIGACSGVGAGLSGLLSLRRHLASFLSTCQSSEEIAFDDWADRIFTDALPEYPVAIRSDAATLNIVYPPDNPGLTRLRARRKGAKQDVGQDVGWIVVASKQMKDNHYFGDLKIGTLADGFGRAADAPALVAAGINYLAEAGADIIVANFLHSAWVRACCRAGMIAGPSNYNLFVSPGGPLLREDHWPPEEIHVARGHGDGLAALV
ncbi:MAG: hypothetical protein ACREA2_23435 [Blastocatellia bacterium]